MSTAKSAKHALSKVEGDAKVKLKKWLGGAFASLACLARGDFLDSVVIDSCFMPVG